MSDTEDVSYPPSAHGEPPEGLCCLVTMEDITLEDGNYVEFQSAPSMTWHPALFEQSVVEQMRTSQFTDYVNRARETDCQAELRRLLASGPPIYISDPHGFPLPEGDTHVVRLWYSCDNQERSAKLEGALEGEARNKLWDELRQFLVLEGKEEGDDD